ncbi:UvrD-helicase domain-containing protein [Hazenella coriacea]|uniref:DNA 3'-5' helicase n=1 Tax=Hazenella coriacea TaxID=1179467 RepID=A0A4V2UV97_9BACL|nr:UvrD-helicase domain-containing protein [Hazenella coriacea]TCS94917.1 ATP-dependent exoDNAse (exonuclease V) beta subunit [Hazenella coriacea]
MTTKPKIQLTSEQQRAVDSLDFDCIVTAGAGSGKTRVLVERYLHICEKHHLQPHILEQTVAITFTEKAATEMKERIRNGLLSRYQTEMEVDQPEAEAWYLLATELDRARIMTIHSFCKQILQRYPIEAGVYPDFTILEDFESRWLLKEAVQVTLRELFLKQSLPDSQWSQLERWLVGVGMNAAIQHFTQVYLELSTHGWTPEDLKQITIQHLKEAEEDLTNREREHVQIQESIFQCVDFLCQVKKKLKKVPPFRERWSDLREQWDQRTTLPEQMALLEALCGSDGVGGNWGRDSEIKETIGRCKELCGEYLKDLHGRYFLQDEHELLEALFDVIAQIHQRYLQSKQKQGGVDFDELQWRVCQLLENHDEIRQEIQQRIKYLMVDEYQDTNDLQKRMIDLITKDEQGRAAPGKRFVVGDPKQSIYRFRGADVSMFHQTLSEITDEGGQPVELNQNFRSHPALIDFYNRLFQQLMSSESASPNYFVEIKAREMKEQENLNSVVHFIAVPDPKELPEKANRHEAEAILIAQQIQQLVEEGKGKYKDFAILFRAMTHVKTYEKEFNRWGIPFHVVKGRGFYDRQEVLDLLHFLRLLIDPDHRLSMVGVLRSPFCGLSDEALFQLVMQFQWQGSFQDWIKNSEIREEEKRKLDQFAHFYSQAQEWVGALTVPDLMERLLEESGYLAVLWATARGKQSVANLKKLIRQAKGLKGFEAYSIHHYLERIDLLMEEQQIETEASVENEHSNSVKIMTIHQSKGLEFPIVVVPDLSYSNPLRMPDLKVDFSMGLVTSFKDEYGTKIEFERFRQAKEREQRLEWEESVRLFYVAATRAEQLLIFSGIPDRLKENQTVEDERKWSKWLDGIFSYDQIDRERNKWEIGDPCLPIHVMDELFVQDSGPKVQKSGDEEVDQEPLVMETFPDVAPMLHSQGISPDELLEINVTSWKSLLNCPRKYFYRHRLGLPEIKEDQDNIPPRKQYVLSSVTKGSIVHRVIELWSLSQEKMNDWTPLLTQVWEEFKVPDPIQEQAEREIAPYISCFLESDIAQELSHLAPDQVFTELPFSLPLGGLQVTGVIDLYLRPSTGSCQMIDYKTDQVTNDQVEALAHEYKPQLQLYTLAIQQIEGTLPDEATLLFLKPGIKYTFPVDQEWMREAKERLWESVEWLRSFDLTQPWTAVPGERCQYCHYNFLCDKAMSEPM